MHVNQTIPDQIVCSYLAGQWHTPDDSARAIYSAVTGEQIARAGQATLNVDSMLRYAKESGGPALRALSFHDRARMIKQLALHLQQHTNALTELAFHSGATRADSTIDIDGGIATLFVFASKGRRELPDNTICPDGQPEQLSRNGTFIGQHVYTSRPGVAVHINAFNFPVWGMLEKLAPTLLAGMPAIIKPATATSYITEACCRIMIDSGILPPGSVQLVAGSTHGLLNHLTAQDIVTFTGSAQTATILRNNQHLQKNAVPFTAEQDSLNATLLASDINADSEDFNIFTNEIVKELTTKAGQKCTAIRRILVPAATKDNIINALSAGLSSLSIGDPSLDTTEMGALVSTRQREDVIAIAAQLSQQATTVYDGSTRDNVEQLPGAFMAPRLYWCDNPDQSEDIHQLEAFGPVATIMPYRNMQHAFELLNRGAGSLVASVVTNDGNIARQAVSQSAPWHGRLYFNNHQSSAEATGHGSPLPHMVHGGPGRAGGGEELGGVRAVKHYMQRTALQGPPDLLQAIVGHYLPGASNTPVTQHPFRTRFNELIIGETLHTGLREITLDDIEHFAHFTGDTFYAHMDDEAASANPFFPGRVAHGYLLLSFAAGLFVDPDPGPVLANTGLTDLAFQKPVSAGESIKVALTVKLKTQRNEQYGEVRWHVSITNQNDELVATYQLHTMNAI
ncbi:MAG: phenylacetic acid degradation bifunctional protein PaaZ [Pseudomonadota bacterium]